MTLRSRSIALAVLALGVFDVGSADAQVIGTFRWKFAPYCNVVTLQVEQKGTIFSLSGTDDACNGSAPASTANGSAHVNANGTVGMSLIVVRPDGLVITNAMTLDVGTFSGTWRDEWGNSGTLEFSPTSSAGGVPKPLTMRGDVTIQFTATAIGQSGATSIAFPRPLPTAPAAPLENVIPVGGPATAACPGLPNRPSASPGHVCLYLLAQINVSLTAIGSGATGDAGASSTGFVVVSSSSAAGAAGVIGRWAATAP